MFSLHPHALVSSYSLKTYIVGLSLSVGMRVNKPESLINTTSPGTGFSQSVD